MTSGNTSAAKQQVTQQSEGLRQPVQNVLVPESHAGQRIDNFLLNRLRGVPRARIYRMLRKGEVRVNKGRVKPVYKLQENDLIRIPPVSVSDKRVILTASGSDRLAWLEETILHEDDGLLVLNKPAGMAVHGGSGVSWGVIEALRVLRPDCLELELVHRLDRETSGCLLIAKKRSKLRQLHALLREGSIVKIYRALVAGAWPVSHWKVEQPLLKIEKSGERVVVIHPEGKAASTFFHCLEPFGEASLMEVRLDSGRTHQIRVHAAWSGHPVVGDEKYGDPDVNARMRMLGLHRMFLHASGLRFRLPDELAWREYLAPEPVELEQFLRELRG